MKTSSRSIHTRRGSSGTIRARSPSPGIAESPNIAAIYGIEQSSGRKFLVMEMVPGETLAERIRRGSIPVNAALGMIEARGLATVVFSEAHRGSSALVSALTARGFGIHPVQAS
jgi:hypothetical protein